MHSADHEEREKPDTSVTSKRRTIIITDLDGTLLDAETYSFEAARPALEAARRRNVPLILCSSKTRAELEVYRQRLQNGHPFIVENGGALYVPAGYFPHIAGGEWRNEYQRIPLGSPYAEVRKAFERLRDELSVPVHGFGDMTADEIAALTGLAPEDAVRAQQREYGEPFVFRGPPDERFLRAIEEAGLHWTQGRLFHIMGNHDKGKAVKLLRRLFVQNGSAVDLIGLGNSLNDLPLLLAVDRPVLVRKKSGSFEPGINIPSLERTRGAGPAGWNEAVLKILSDDE